MATLSRLLLIFSAIFQLIFAQNLTVKIEDGFIMGSVMKTRLGNDFYAFRGIPYAEPPLGDLRFQVSNWFYH
jgi:hypothetical protein